MQARYLDVCGGVAGEEVEHELDGLVLDGGGWGVCMCGYWCLDWFFIVFFAVADDEDRGGLGRCFF